MADDFDPAAFKAGLERRFRTPLNETLFSNSVSKDPIAISRIQVGPSRTRLMSPQPAYAVHVYLSPPSRLEGWLDGRHARFAPLGVGDIAILDLDASPILQFHQPADFLRVQISRRSLHELAFEFDERPPAALPTTLGGVNDLVLLSLARALVSKGGDFAFRDRLFTDAIGLAFYTRIVSTHAESPAPGKPSSGLAPWQSLRACDLMTSNLDGGMTLAELAAACEVSPTYFARAFRRTMGVSAHQWLMSARPAGPGIAALESAWPL